MLGYCRCPNKTHTTCRSITGDKGVSSIHAITVYKEQKHTNTHWKIIANGHSSLLLLVTRPQMLDTSFQELDLDFVHTHAHTHTKCVCAHAPPPPHTHTHTLCVEIVEGKNEYWRYMYARLSTRMRMVKCSI